GGKKITLDKAKLCLENLFIFMDFVSYCYGTDYEQKQFNKNLLNNTMAEWDDIPKISEPDLKALLAENKKLKEQLTARREKQQQTYVPRPLDLSEYKTRKMYIDTMLQEAGWVENKDWQSEVKISGMPNASETGYADYVLYDHSYKPL